MTAHARLSASGSARWINCPGSVQAEDGYEDRGSAFAAEGTAAHALAEACLLNGLDASEGAEASDGEWTPYDSPDFRESVQTYLDYCRALPGEHLVEVELDTRRWIPEGFGTADFVAVDDDTLHVADLKFGKGVKVDGEGNSQARIYALGAFEALRAMYVVKRVVTHIVQPRLDWISTEELTVEELMQWADDELVPAAKAAVQPNAPRRPSEKACQWCKAKAVCRDRAEANLALAQEEFGELPSASTLSPAELGEIVVRLDELIRWAGDVKDHALAEALQGRPPPGTKIVEGRGRRVWIDDALAAGSLLDAGLAEDVVYVKKINTLTAIEKALGKKHPLLPQICERKSGKPALVSADDPRPEYTPADAAALDFAD